MSSSTKNKQQQPDKDPFDVLDVSFAATDAQIQKAYRKLALKLHPDKQHAGTEKEQAAAAVKFHDIQQARAFLLDDEFLKAREQYKLQRVSKQVRKEADVAREKGMSARRKQMREDLHRQEAAASAGRGTSTTTSTAKPSSASSRKRQRDDDVERLRRQGQELRDSYADKAAEKAVDRETATQSLDERRVRLKWSRKKMKESPSEHSLASLFVKFGTVERVEMLGSKGNSALVTFEDASAVTPCIQAYQDSDEMRASYVGTRKQREEDEQHATDQAQAVASKARRTEKGRDTEDVDEWKRRQAAERERLLREMEEEDTGTAGATSKTSAKSNAPARAVKPFPPPFPDAADYTGLSPLQQLEHAESILLKSILSPDALQSARVS